MNIARDVPSQSVSYQMAVVGIPEMEELGANSMTFVVADGQRLSSGRRRM
ncbi:MAG: hypothetical protein HC802_11310 [Caldilineaceae bacterium]|nr:hypothetical protein [Caldilineaceae bacterium]